jgi:hypothetical protein
VIYTTRDGQSYGTDRQLSQAERHVLQKLLIWRKVGLSPEEFQRRRAEALAKGWNNQGPVEESAALAAISRDLLARLRARSSGDL